MKPKHDYDRVLDYIIKYKLQHDGNSPSYREIARACSITSTCVVSYILRKLEYEGKISLVKNNKKRDIQVMGGRWTYDGS